MDGLQSNEELELLYEIKSIDNIVKPTAVDWIYDLEVFPNLFCVTFLNAETQEKKVYGVFGERDTRAELREFLSQPIRLVGYNNLAYDGVILYAIAFQLRNGPTDFALSQLFNISSKLISRDWNDKTIQRYPKGIKYTQLDLMQIMNFHSLGIGLKQVAINLKWPRIQDLPLPYNYEIQTVDEVKMILDYNLNDVLITQELYRAIQSKIKLRDDLSNLYNVDLGNSSDSNMANKLLERIYTQSTGVDIRDLKELRTKRDSILIGDCMGENISFRTHILQKLHEDLKGITVRSTNQYAYKRIVQIGSTIYDLGVGGLHSRDIPSKFIADESCVYRDSDVISYYTSIMLENNIKPEHLDHKFLPIVSNIKKERTDAKKSGDDVKSEGLKITINSIFGKLRSDTFWLEDPKAFLSVTVSGQLYLLMLIESLELNGIHVISANTDGIITKVTKENEVSYKHITSDWMKLTGFELEFTDYSLYVRTDVNNYLAVPIKGKIKTKGRYAQKIDLMKGYKHPITSRCLYEYFVNKKPVCDTLSESRDILDYCISQKTGGKFQLEHHTLKGVEKLQKTNRFYIANRGGILIKRNNDSNEKTGLYVGKQVRILNNYDPSLPFESYDVDISFYRKEAQSYIEEIEPSIIQASFGF